ncbi:hypothetical protein ACFVAF_06985 [Streptomyces sp. NPDC057596]|uniref:hypothetical protein n=1 Tax=Streptomyces sp. NPDC057596 TaxID=3346178 RepID=UPI0036C3DBA6
MLYSNELGVLPAVLTGTTIGLLGLYWAIRPTNRLHLSFCAGLACAASAMVYALLNPLLQVSDFSAAHLRDEIANGHLALRATSLIIGFSFCVIFWRVAHEKAPEYSMGADPEKDLRTMTQEARRGIWTLERAAAQGVLFMVILVGLWVLVITSRTSTLIAILNWAFLFIVDDFVMSANYIAHRRVGPPKLDAWKIAGCSLGTVVLFVIILFQEFDRWVGWTVLCFTLLIAMVTLFRAVAPFLAAAASNFGIMPEEDDWRPDEEEGVLIENLKLLRDQGVLTEEELSAKLHLVPLLYEHGHRAHEMATALPEQRS